MDYIGDVTHTTDAAARFFAAYQQTKSAKDVTGTMAFFDPDRVTYIDATLGWSFDFAALHGVFAQYMPNWSEGRSYATQILGTERSAMLFIRDTPELFGSDLLIIGAVDVEHGRITRWVDYWDGRNAPPTRGLKVADDQFPHDFGEDSTPQGARGAIVEVVGRLAAALAAAQPDSAAAEFAEDATIEDMTLRTRIRGRAAIERYLERAVGTLPYGAGSAVRRVAGGDTGGGYEWTTPHAVTRGVTAVQLDHGLITSLTAVWDGAAIDDDTLRKWSDLAHES